MATEKTVNYTNEQTAMVIEQYLENPTTDTVAKLAETLGKTVRSITMKLVREKVYVKKEYTTKTGGKVVKKDSLIDKLSEFVEFTENEQTSFEHVNKTALVKLINKLQGYLPVTE